MTHQKEVEIRYQLRDDEAEIVKRRMRCPFGAVIQPDKRILFL